MELKVGDKVSCLRAFSAKDVEAFAELSGDFNPIHLDEEFAKKSIFGKRIVHGFLVGSQISRLIANELPGPGSIYLKQTMNFRSPAYLDDEITTDIVITEIPKPNIYILQTICKNQDGTVLVDGDAVIKKIKT